MSIIPRYYLQRFDRDDCIQDGSGPGFHVEVVSGNRKSVWSRHPEYTVRPDREGEASWSTVPAYRIP